MEFDYEKPKKTLAQLDQLAFEIRINQGMMASAEAMARSISKVLQIDEEADVTKKTASFKAKIEELTDKFNTLKSIL